MLGGFVSSVSGFGESSCCSTMEGLKRHLQFFRICTAWGRRTLRAPGDRGSFMNIMHFLQRRRMALLASLAVIGAAAGGSYFYMSLPNGYSCEGLLMPKADATEYLKLHAPDESIGNSKTCIPQWIRAPEV